MLDRAQTGCRADGALAYFASVNKRGGVFGCEIELKIYKDGRDVKRVIENTERFIHRDKALIQCV